MRTSSPTGALLLAAALAGSAGLAAPAAVASVLSDRFGGYEDCLSYGEGAGRAAPAVPAVYEALVVGQAPVTPRHGPLLRVASRPTFEKLERPICRITPDGPQPLTPAPQTPPPQTPPPPMAPAAAPGAEFAGAWLFRGIPGQQAFIQLTGPGQIVATTEKGVSGQGVIQGDGTIVVAFPFGTLTGVLAGPRTLHWSNGENWIRP
jgi:hypothetical protein